MRARLLLLLLAGLLAVAWTLRETWRPASGPPRVGAPEEGRELVAPRGSALSLEPRAGVDAPAARRPARTEAARGAPLVEDAASSNEPALHPVAARVVRATGEPVPAARFVHPRGEVEVRADGDGEGNYELRLPAGAWVVTAASESPRLVPAAEAFDAVVEVPHVGPPLLFVLHQPARLEGLVVDAAGAPAPGAEVRLTSIPVLHEVAATDDLGRYRFADLPVGDVALVATLGELEAGRVVSLREGENLAPALELPAGGWLVVQALDEDGAARDDVRTLLFRDARQIGNGEEPGVRYGPLAAGPVEVLGIYPRREPRQPSERIVTRAAEIVAGEVTEVNLRPPTPRAVVEGVVRRAGAPFPGVILAFLEGGGLAEGVQLLRTDERGRYRLELPGPAAVVFALDLGGGVRVISHLPWTDAEHVRHDIDLVAVRLHGRIEGFAPGDGWGVVLQAEPRAVELALPRADASRPMRGDGTFAFDALRPGKYRLWAFENEGDVAGPVSVDLQAGRDEAEVTLVRRAAGSVSGTVRDASGQPMAHAVVHVRTADGGAHPALGRTDAAGRFEVAGIPPGEALVCAQSDAGVSVARLRVAAGRTAPIELSLAPGARLRVRARGPGGAPTPACLRAFDGAGAEVSPFRGPAGSADSFTALVSSSERVFGPLPPGRYEVTAETSAGGVARRAVVLGARDVEVELEP